MSSKPYFDRVAEAWDTMRSGFFSEAVRDKALAVADVAAGALAADIGAGSGFVTEALLAAGLRVVAVDPSEAMLDVMRRKFGAERVDYRVGEAETLPLDSGSVSAVFANMCLHHVERPPEAIREMARILEPGGRLVITDLDTHDFAFLRDEHQDRWLGFARDDLRRWFEDAGLRDVAVQDANCACCAESQRGTQRASVSIFVASGVKLPQGDNHEPGRTP